MSNEVLGIFLILAFIGGMLTSFFLLAAAFPHIVYKGLALPMLSMCCGIATACLAALVLFAIDSILH